MDLATLEATPLQKDLTSLARDSERRLSAGVVEWGAGSSGGVLLGEVSGEGREVGFITGGAYNTTHPARQPDPVSQGQACVWVLRKA